MAIVTNAFSTYTAIGDREDLSNLIYDISPTETPIMTSIGRRNVTNVTFDWQSEALPAVSTSPELEGFELSRTATTPTTRLSNNCQIQKRDATVTGSQQASNPAGRGSGEMAHQMALASKALKRDVEKNISIQNGLVAGDATTARKTRAWESWMTTNVSRGSGGGNAAAATDAPTDGVQRPFTEALLKTVMQSCYTSGAEPSMLVVGPVNKGKVSAFTGRASARQNIDATAIQASVSMYASDFGDLKVMPSRWIRERSALLIDPEYAAVGFFRNFQQVQIANIGDAATRMLVVEFGLEMRNEAAMGIVADLDIT